MAGQRCQVCGGKVVNGRCSLCGMPYRNDEVLYHLNEPREIHYKHASAKVRDMMRQYGQDADQTTQHNGNVCKPQYRFESESNQKPEYRCSSRT